MTAIIGRNHCSLGLLALASALAAGSVLAYDPPAADAPSGAMNQAMDHMKGDSMHTMPATVDAVDHAIGIVDVTAGGMKLKVHFPPASLAAVKDHVASRVHQVGVLAYDGWRHGA